MPQYSLKERSYPIKVGDRTYYLFFGMATVRRLCHDLKIADVSEAFDNLYSTIESDVVVAEGAEPRTRREIRANTERLNSVLWASMYIEGGQGQDLIHYNCPKEAIDTWIDEFAIDRNMTIGAGQGVLCVHVLAAVGFGPAPLFRMDVTNPEEEPKPEGDGKGSEPDPLAPGAVAPEGDKPKSDESSPTQ